MDCLEHSPLVSGLPRLLSAVCGIGQTFLHEFVSAAGDTQYFSVHFLPNRAENVVTGMFVEEASMLMAQIGVMISLVRCIVANCIHDEDAVLEGYFASNERIRVAPKRGRR